mgnify:CR=1 FL=1
MMATTNGQTSGTGTDAKRRKDRAYQQKHRNSKRSYVTEIENLGFLLAWESGDLSEGQLAKRLGIDRVELRDMRINAITVALKAFGDYRHSR